MGYKSQFGVPDMVRRQFARLSGLLELADEEFIRTRDQINDYIDETREKIKNDNAEGVTIDMISLAEYMQYNRKMRVFLEEIASIEGSDIQQVDPENYIGQLKWLGITTIGQIQQKLEKNHDLALALAENSLRGSELDILSSNAALRYLCQAELLAEGYSEAQVTDFIRLTSKDDTRAERQAKLLFRHYDAIKNGD